MTKAVQETAAMAHVALDEVERLHARIASLEAQLAAVTTERDGLRRKLRASQDQYAEADFASIQRGEGSLSGFKP